MINFSCIVLVVLLICVVVLGLYVELLTSSGRHIFSVAYANIVKYVYTSLSFHIVDCGVFI